MYSHTLFLVHGAALNVDHRLTSDPPPVSKHTAVTPRWRGPGDDRLPHPCGAGTFAYVYSVCAVYVGLRNIIQTICTQSPQYASHTQEYKNHKWERAKKMMANVDQFKARLQAFKGETIPEEDIARVAPFIENAVRMN